MDVDRDTYVQLEEGISAAIGAADPEAFEPLALEIYRLQRRFNFPYEQYCRLLDAPKAPKSWEEIPAVPQTAFKHASLRIFSQASEVAAFHTSGTSGEGYGTHHFCSLRLYEEAILRGWDLAGFPALPHIVLTPAPAHAPHSSLSHMMGVLEKRSMGGQHWCVRRDGKLDIPTLRSTVEHYREARRPVMLLGTALAFLHWFESLEGATLQLPPGSVAFETGGYKGTGRTLAKADLYAMFQHHLGIAPDSIINEYGMTELSSQCYTRGLGGVHTAPPWMRAVVVNPATGEQVTEGATGVLWIYDLANLGSVLAIQTRDLATRHGAEFELIGRDPEALPRGCSRAADEMMG
jgi:hypothetical protein